MILAIDCGNTHSVLGVYDDDLLLASWRISTDASKTEDEYLVLLKELFQSAGLKFTNITTLIVASVVPPVNFALSKLVEKHLPKTKLIFVDDTTPTGISIVTDNPKEVGADRIVNALAAHEKYGGDLIVVDFGTATTFDCISADGEYFGGAICPGIEISKESLFSHAAKLSDIVLSRPPKVIAANTADSLRSGILWGYGGQVDSLVRRMENEWGKKVQVIATGGLASLISEFSETIDQVDMDLTLDGLRLVCTKIKELN
jgi:type III pantothenate kinase